MFNEVNNEINEDVTQEASGTLQATILRSGTIIFATSKNEVKLPLSADTRAIFKLLN